MAYNDTPNPADQVNNTQSRIKDNFTEIASIIAKDHIPFTGAALEQGKHSQSTYILSANDPSTLVNEMAIYNKGNDLYIQPQNVLAGVDGINFTEKRALADNNGGTTLPSGIKLRWGRSAIALNQSTSPVISFRYPVVAPAPTVAYFTMEPFCVLITAYDGAGDFRDYLLRATGITAEQFQAKRDTVRYYGTAAEFSYLAIGI